MQVQSIIPQTYAQWRQCIEVACKQALTRRYMLERLEELAQPHNFKTQQFIQHYGAAHHRQVIMWFEQAFSELELPAK
jgi:hypothetical protein